MATTTDTGPRTPVVPVKAPAKTNFVASQAALGQKAFAAATPAIAPKTPATTPLTADQQQEQSTLQSASAQITNFLSSVPGLSALDPTRQLGSWMNSQTAALYGQGITDPTQILNTIESTMNNPSGDPAAQQVFDSLFPGYNQKIQNGTTDQNGSYTGLAGYIQYANQINAYSQTAGLTSGTVSAQDIGNLWAGNVSAGEVSDRITSAYVAATNTPQEVQDYLKTTYGMNAGDITSYYLNPTNSLANLNAVNTGIAGVETGFGSLSQSQAASLSAFLAPTSSNGVNPVSSQQAANALTSNLGGGVDGSASQLAGLETASPGQNSTGTVSQNELLSAMGVPGQGTTQAQALIGVSNAQQTRTAGARGGGGAATTSNGAAGLGFAES